MTSIVMKTFLILHILSNVLDILDFDFEGFAELFKSQTKGYNQFVCVEL